MPLPRWTPEVSALDLFLSVAEAGSLSQAARLHRITQAAASMRLSGLEHRLGLRLLERTTTGSILTHEGRVFAEFAQLVVGSARELIFGVQTLQAEQAGQLRLSASMTVAEYLVPTWVAQLHDRNPGLHVTVHVGNSAEVERAVSDRVVDIGFTEGATAPLGVRSRVVGTDELILVVEPHHPWARLRRPVPASELADTPLVTREVGSGTRDVLERRLASLGYQTKTHLELGATTAVKEAVMAGEGPTCLSRLAVQVALDAGRLVEVALNGLDLRRQFYAIWLPGRSPMGPTALLLSVIASSAASGQASGKRS